MTARRVARTVAAIVLVVGTVSGLTACGGGDDGPKLTGAAAQGQKLAAAKGCAACHSADGSISVGPSWKGSWGKEVALEDGGTATFDAGYVERAVRKPTGERREGTNGQMPVFDTSRISDAELASIVAYLQALGAPSS